jgi:hypothetical protein
MIKLTMELRRRVWSGGIREGGVYSGIILYVNLIKETFIFTVPPAVASHREAVPLSRIFPKLSKNEEIFQRKTIITSVTGI